MKTTKRQLKQIIREEKRKLIQESSSYEEIKRIRDSGDYEWMDMEYEVVDLMESMQEFPAKDVIDIMYSALDAEDRQDASFWHMMLSDGGHLYEALDGLKNTADEEYDPDIPVTEGKLNMKQLRRIIREERRSVLAAGTPESSLESAVEQIEAILNSLWDEGHSNSQLKTLLTQMMRDIDSGFIGEPT